MAFHFKTDYSFSHSLFHPKNLCLIMKMCEYWLKCHILFNEQSEVVFDESDFAPVSYLNEPISISSFVTDTSWIFNYQCTYLNICFFVSSIWWCLQSLEKFKIVWVFQFLLKSWIFKWNVWEILMAGSVTLHRHLCKMFEWLWFILVFLWVSKICFTWEGFINFIFSLY